jgi:hypothetical protein
VVSFTPQLLYLRGNTPGTHWIGGWVDLRAGFDAPEKSLLPPPRIELSFLGRLARSLVTILTYLCQLPQESLERRHNVAMRSPIDVVILSGSRSRIFEFSACIFRETVISKCPSRSTMCKRGSVEELSLTTVARDGNCQIFPLNFQLVNH